MTYYPDLSPFAYGFHPASWTADGPPGTGPEVLYGWDDDGWGEGAFHLPELNVGWLDPRHDVPRGGMAPELVRKLEALCAESRYHLMRGWHHCGFCDDRDARSHAEIRIMGEGVVYAAPTLIAHYVAAHGYLPPAGFVRALAACDGLAEPDPEARRPVAAELIPRAPVAIPELQERIRAQQEAEYRHHTFPEVTLREEGDHVSVFARIVPRPGTAPIERSWRVPRAALLNPEQAAAGIISMLDRVHMQLPRRGRRVTTQTTAAAQYAKGSTLRSTLAFVRSLGDEGAVERVMGRLSPDDLARVQAAAPTDEVPLELLHALWRAVDAEIGAEHPDWPERSGAFSIASAGVEHYSGILRKKSPAEFLLQRVSLFRLFYQPGNQEVVEEEQGHAVLRLVGFDPGDRFFCRRQAGGLLRAVELAGGVNATVRHVRCSLEGDAFCEWELRWDTPAE